MTINKDLAMKLWNDIYGDKRFVQDCFGTRMAEMHIAMKLLVQFLSCTKIYTKMHQTFEMVLLPITLDLVEKRKIFYYLSIMVMKY